MPQKRVLPQSRRQVPRTLGAGSPPATLQSIAKLCGVSKATVSRTLNGNRALVAPETITRILRTASQLDYRPNQAARSLARRAVAMRRAAAG